MASCKSCGASVRFVKTQTGKSMPLDTDPSPAGNVIIAVDGVAMVLSKAAAASFAQPRYLSHFATCPSANQHRKAKKT